MGESASDRTSGMSAVNARRFIPGLNMYSQPVARHEAIAEKDLAVGGFWGWDLSWHSRSLRM